LGDGGLKLSAPSNSLDSITIPVSQKTVSDEPLRHWRAEDTSRFASLENGDATSELGQKQTLQHLQSMSALPPKADIGT